MCKNANEFKIKFFVYSSLLMVVLIVIPLYDALQKKAHKQGKQVSMIKVCEFVAHFFALMLYPQSWEMIQELALYYCTYEPRKKRKNMIQIIYEDF